MQYSIATLAALATAVLAVQPHFTNTAFDVVEGSPFTISFDGCADGCTIVLQNGDSKDLKDYKTLTASAEGGSFTFTPTDLPTDKYNFKITDNDSGEYNYSDQFSYEGDAVATTETSSTAVSTTKAATSTTEKATSTTEEATSTTEKATSSTSKAVSTTEKATTLTKAVSTPSRNNTTPVSSAASSTEDSSSTATEDSTSTAAETTAATTVPDSGAARISSSIALIAGAVMAMVYLN